MQTSWLVWCTFVIYFAVIDPENGGKDITARSKVRGVQRGHVRIYIEENFLSTMHNTTQLNYKHKYTMTRASIAIKFCFKTSMFDIRWRKGMTSCTD